MSIASTERTSAVGQRLSLGKAINAGLRAAMEADPKVLAFLMARAERSLAGLVRLVERLDARALEGRSGRRRVTVPLARRCLELLDSERPEAG